MKTKLFLSYLFILSVISVNADTDKYRLVLTENTNNPATSITVAWNQIDGASPTVPTVYYDTVDHGTNHSLYSFSQPYYKSISFKGMDNRFAQLTGLLPNTNYYFVIHDDNSTSQRFWFKTAPADNSRLSFIAGGDSRNNSTARKNANLLVSKLKPHAVLFGGDMTNGNSSLEWQEWFDDWQDTTAADGRMFPIVPARGNHESDASTIYNLFDTNINSYYAVTFGANLIRAYTLNSEISVLGSQLTWLQNDLTSPANSSVIWKSAQYHKPMRPHTAWKSENNNQYSAWAQLFYDEDVRLVIDCDSHMAKTTWPVKPSSDSDNDEGFVVDQINGTVYTGEGCWGAPLRTNDDDKSWTRNSGSFNQFKLIFVETSKIELRTIKVDNAASVGSVSNTDPFTLPANLDVFNPPTGDVVTISNTNDTSCPEINTPCDDGDSTTVFSIEDGSCNCVGLDENLVEVFSADVINGNDDAEEDVSTGNMYVTSSDLELINDKDININQLVGVRFNALNLPSSATILRAYVQFTSNNYGNYIDPTNLLIHGELSTNSTTFSLTSHNIFNRTTTANSVAWSNIKRWGSNGIAGFYERTPNLKDVLDEIIAQPTWTNGSPISFIFSGSGRRAAKSYEGNGPATLKIIYLHNLPIIIGATVGAQGACNPLDDTYSQDITLTYNNPPTSGNLNVNGQLFSIGASPQTVTLTGLNADGIDVDLSAFFTDDATYIYSKEEFFEAPSKCSMGNLPDNVPDDNINLALLTEATLSGSVNGGRGTPSHILYDPVMDKYHLISDWNEYGVSYSQNIGTPDVDHGMKWQVNWPNVKYINYITFGGTYPGQEQPNTMWRISYRLDGSWIILDEGQGGWIDSGIYEWGGGTENPIEADALRVQLYSDGINDVISIHLRARGGVSNFTNDSSTTPKATLIQYLSPGNSCGVTIPSGSLLYCSDDWINTNGPDETTGTKNTIIADGIYIIDVDTDVEVNDLEILSGATLIIKEGGSLTVKGNLTNNGSLELESISTKYSSLIVEGTSTGDVIYKRHVNTFNNTTGSATGQNDLISAPVTNSSQTFGVFRATNTNIPSGNIGGVFSYLFGPYNNDTNAYQNYTVANDGDDLEIGIGYRTASTNTSTFTFIGDVNTSTIPVGITSGTSSAWNLIGNPYPSYINSGDFLTENATDLDENAIGIYGYDGTALNGWTVINFANMNEATNIAPGQGFMVKAEAASASLDFTPTMRRKSGGDDFIALRTTDTNAHLKIKIESGDLNYSTDFYFNVNSTRGLDPGYDAALFDGYSPEFYIYSHLVENNEGRNMAIQSLGQNDLMDVTIPLGINADQGEAITFSINTSSLPETIEIYLEDSVTNTFTLLNSGDYTITPNTNLNGTGRFYLHIETDVLGTIEQSLESLDIYSDSIEKTIVINGQLRSDTYFKLYDISGRIVNSKALDIRNTNQSIDVASLSVGIYIVELLSNVNEKRIQKLIIR